LHHPKLSEDLTDYPESSEYIVVDGWMIAMYDVTRKRQSSLLGFLHCRVRLVLAIPSAAVVPSIDVPATT
jgi:hypothetical protein